jgi:formate dehydrogenase iron-sulfur subunit
MQKESRMSTYAMLNDLTKCIGCRACQVACKEWNELEYGRTYFTNTRDNPPVLQAETYTRIEHKYLPDVEESLPQQWYYRRHMCHHCETPSCVSVCPVGGLTKTAEGPVAHDADACIGCRMCQMACPFGIPKHDAGSIIATMHKCNLCYDRVNGGQEPACSKACLTDAITWGPREDQLDKAHHRIAMDPDRYQDQVYGENVVGGTSVLFLSTNDISLDEFGFRTDLGEQVYTGGYSWSVLSRIPGFAVAMGVVLGTICFITHRRMPFMAKKKEKTESPALR